MHPAPVQTLGKRAQLCRRQTHHAIPDPAPFEAPCSSFLAYPPPERGPGGIASSGEMPMCDHTRWSYCVIAPIS